jgi:hypothetical protein
MIRNTKAEHWTEWLEGLDEADLWQVSKLMTAPATDAGKSRILTLQVKDPITKKSHPQSEGKHKQRETLPQDLLPTAKPNNTHTTKHPLPTTMMDLHQHNRRTNTQSNQEDETIQGHKTDTIPNCIFIQAREDLIPHLGPLFQATNTLKHYPPEWSLTETLILKKPGKPDYTNPLAWLPIVLSNGIAQLLNSCQAEDMVTMCKQHNILPANHFRARPGQTTTDSIHMLTKTVKDAW